MLVEDCKLLAFSGSPENAQWLTSETAEALMQVNPEANITPDRAANTLEGLSRDLALSSPIWKKRQ